MQEKLENNKMTPISKVDEYIFELNENLRPNMVNKVPTSLREHANSLYYVLKQLPRHNFLFLKKDGGKNHQPIFRGNPS